jgi:hypothetical protein
MQWAVDGRVTVIGHGRQDGTVLPSNPKKKNICVAHSGREMVLLSAADPLTCGGGLP